MKHLSGSLLIVAVRRVIVPLLYALPLQNSKQSKMDRRMPLDRVD
jgi:hypothetical protein